MNHKASHPHGIKFVSHVTGINAHTIRAWENRYRAITPERDPSTKQRLYSEADIARLKLLKRLNNAGNSISFTAPLPDDALIHMIKNLKDAPEDEEKKYLNLTEEEAESAMTNLRIALEFNRDDILVNEISKLVEKYDPEAFTLKVLKPVISKITKKVVKSYENIQ